MWNGKEYLKRRKELPLFLPPLWGLSPLWALLHPANKTGNNALTWICKTAYQRANIQGNNCSLSDHVYSFKYAGVGVEDVVGKPVPKMAFLQIWQPRRGARGEIRVVHGALRRIQVQTTGIFSLETPSKRQVSLPGTRCLWLVTKSRSQSPSDASFFCEHTCSLLAAP